MISPGKGNDVFDSARPEAMRTTTTRVVVLNEFDVIVGGISTLLRSEPSLEVIEPVSLDVDADIALVDTYGRDLDPWDEIDALVGVRPTRAVVLYTFGADRRFTDEALRRGVRGVVWKGVDLPTLLDDLARIARGETVIDLPVGLSAPPKPPGGWPFRADGLSLRESEVLAHLAAGRSNREIARVLFVSSETVKTHVRSVLRKLAVSNRTEATWKALQSDQFARSGRGRSAPLDPPFAETAVPNAAVDELEEIVPIVS